MLSQRPGFSVCFPLSGPQETPSPPGAPATLSWREGARGEPGGRAATRGPGGERKEAFPGQPCTLWKLCFCVAFVFLFFGDVLCFPWGACAQEGRGVERGAGHSLFRKARTGWTPLRRRRGSVCAGPAVTPRGPGRVRGAGGPQAGLTEKACFLVPFLPISANYPTRATCRLLGTTPYLLQLFSDPPR